MGGILQKMLQAFYTKKLEVVLVGLENRCALRGGAVLS
jgi:ADP-ribosylation factor-like protein 8